MRKCPHLHVRRTVLAIEPLSLTEVEISDSKVVGVVGVALFGVAAAV